MPMFRMVDECPLGHAIILISNNKKKKERRLISIVLGRKPWMFDTTN